MGDTNEVEVEKTTHVLEYGSKSVNYIYLDGSLEKKSASAVPRSTVPKLIFTHGAGGDLESHAVADFVNGFSKISPVVCFAGNSNLTSRVKMFEAVMENQTYWECIGGRSLGARAACIAATNSGKPDLLVLVSYPLQSKGDVRDQILLDLPASIEVMFISGDHDTMCDLDNLAAVRARMPCKSWMVIVKGADHGMNMKPKHSTEEAGIRMGAIAAKWREYRIGVKAAKPSTSKREKGISNKFEHDHDNKESHIFWNAETEKIEWSGWHREVNPGFIEPATQTDFSATESAMRPNPTNELYTDPRTKLHARKRSVSNTTPVPKKAGKSSDAQNSEKLTAFSPKSDAVSSRTRQRKKSKSS
ncbi:hypothetical protein MMC19_003971 [Ptychographa xylographoides]|nr:hypothetical protein [Ptychographa xylographoides]